MPNPITLEEFLRRARAAHGDRYDYSRVMLVNMAKPVTIVCREHGPFNQTLNNHYRGSGCPRCDQERRIVSPPADDPSLDLTARIGHRPRKARPARRWSLAELAARAGIPKHTINGYELGSKRMSLETAQKLADALGTVTTAHLLCVDDETEQSRREAEAQPSKRGSVLDFVPGPGQREMRRHRCKVKHLTPGLIPQCRHRLRRFTECGAAMPSPVRTGGRPAVWPDCWDRIRARKKVS